MLPDRASLKMLARQLAAMVYDGLLLVGVLFVASLPVTLLSGGAIPAGAPAFQLYLLGIIFLYLAWQWTRGGQTLGMKAWRLRLVSNDANGLNWARALLRFLAALLSLAACGLGYAWLLVDRERLTWHDRLSATRLERTPDP
ncbi:putative RDD family membrane protein YckC [Methylohalomonas lacus]|uniref:RDD family membrane protein YckC n=1 Tax=Methylohalomonas lacus TaxID=398773 RepID=A0AAE3L0U2_9GAMM|nr:RDD family protein [Methylohalomonas lacus]MCS3902171.1 putative RDD family membrane protein YckC [Methylohalomonas lacus]